MMIRVSLESRTLGLFRALSPASRVPMDTPMARHFEYPSVSYGANQVDLGPSPDYEILWYPLFSQTHIFGSLKTFSRTVTYTNTKHVQKPPLPKPCALDWAFKSPFNSALHTISQNGNSSKAACPLLLDDGYLKMGPTLA